MSESNTIEAQRQQVLSVTERRIGSCDVTFVGVEHKSSFDEPPWDELKKFIAERNLTMVEYFPLELESGPFTDPVFGSLAQKEAKNSGITPFFGRVAEMAHEEGKPIIVMDPANSINFAIAYRVVPITGAAIGLPLTTLTIDALFPQRKSSDFPPQNKPLTRRQFLKMGLGVLAATVLLPVAIPLRETLVLGDIDSGSLDWVPDPLNDRWVTIAQGLNQFCTTNNKTIMVVYPPDHVKGIIKYIDATPNERKDAYTIYKKILGITRSIRTYMPEGRGQWQLHESVPIV